MQASFDGRPEFMEELPAERAMPRYELVRTPTNKRVTWLILSERALVMPTHWLRNRTTPCNQRDDCEGCIQQIEVRYKVYLAIFTPSTGQTQMLELTDHAGEPVLDFQKRNGSIRGRKITCWRSGRKENSPVNALVAPVLDPTVHVPAAPDVQEFLYRMWYVKSNREERPLFEVPCVVTRGIAVPANGHGTVANGTGHGKATRSK